MVFRNCKNCGKRYYKSPYDRTKYNCYCNNCGVKEFEEEYDKLEKERIEKMVQLEDTGIRDLKRTDNEEDYLDSTRCEYSKSEVEDMKIQLQQLMFKKSHLKQTIRKLYNNIGQCDEMIENLKCKLAIAEREQQLRKKLRRETRELIPTLENVQKQTTNVYKNINELLNENDDDCITIKDDFNK